MSRRLLNRDRLIELLEAASRCRVAVLGDAMLDVYLRGDVERISPEAPVPVVRVRERRHALGGAGNVAQNVRAVGAMCDLVAAIGDDMAGQHLCGMLEAIGAPVASLVTVDRPTTTKTRIVARSQQVVRVDEEEDGDLDGVEVDRLLTAVRRAVDNAQALVLEDYNKGVLVPSVIEAAMQAARGRGIPIVVDPKYRNFFLYRGATIFKPNRRELEGALGAAVDLEHERVRVVDRAADGGEQSVDFSAIEIAVFLLVDAHDLLRPRHDARLRRRRAVHCDERSHLRADRLEHAAEMLSGHVVADRGHEVAHRADRPHVLRDVPRAAERMAPFPDAHDGNRRLG